MFCKAIVRGLLSVALVCCAVAARGDVFNMGGTRNPTTGTWTGLASLQFVTVGDPGNAADTAVMVTDGTTGYGAVPYTYQMGKYDVTVGQYTAFLNAVAKTDTNGLYNGRMSLGYYYRTIGITQSGSSGNYSYSVSGSDPQAANCPIFDVTWGDAARFCNWLQNGQPTFNPGTPGEVAGSTETGAYTLTGDTSSLLETRNAGATYFLPSENEWYKAAYYEGGSTNAGYWTYPTQNNTPPGNTLPDAGNSANYRNYGYTDSTNLLTPVGAFAASPGPYGTFDMGGDVWEWNEAIIDSEYRGLRGGGWYDGSDPLASSDRVSTYPTNEDDYVGFRVADVPEPGSLAMLVGIALTALLYYWRKHA